VLPGRSRRELAGRERPGGAGGAVRSDRIIRRSLPGGIGEHGHISPGRPGVLRRRTRGSSALLRRPSAAEAPGSTPPALDCRATCAIRDAGAGADSSVGDGRFRLGNAQKPRWSPALIVHRGGLEASIGSANILISGDFMRASDAAMWRQGAGRRECVRLHGFDGRRAHRGWAVTPAASSIEQVWQALLSAGVKPSNPAACM
jgi:hypothetical protein